jgi:putative thioredoxin
MDGLSFAASEGDFDTLVVERSHKTPVLVDISAEWCAPCRVLAPMLHRVVASYQGQFLLALVDADENMRIAGRHKVRGFPTVIAYSRGVEVDRFHGAKPEGFLREFVERLIAQHSQVTAAG